MNKVTYVATQGLPITLDHGIHDRRKLILTGRTTLCTAHSNNYQRIALNNKLNHNKLLMVLDAGRLSLVKAVAPLSIEGEALAHYIVLPHSVPAVNALPTEFHIPAAKRSNARLKTSTIVLMIRLFG